MEIKFNSAFQHLLDKYRISADLHFDVEMPRDVQQILEDNIVVNEFGIGLESNWEPRLIGTPDEQSFHEDNKNHFHVDWYIDEITDKKAFQLGIKTLVKLAQRFQAEGLANIQFNYSFQTPEMGRLQAQEANIIDDGHLISDRLSFHTKRPRQIVVDEKLFHDKHQAFFIIDI